MSDRLVPISAQSRAGASPSPSWRGPALQAEPPGPQSHTGASMRKVTGVVGRGHPVAHFEVVPTHVHSGHISVLAC